MTTDFRAKPARPPIPSAHMPASAWLACLLCLALAWSGLGLPCLPCLGLVQQQQPTAPAQPPPAAEGGRLLLLDQAKARQARQAQARPSQGKAQQASQPSQSRHFKGPRGPWSKDHFETNPLGKQLGLGNIF